LKEYQELTFAQVKFVMLSSELMHESGIP
jgi:hypothetical protein